MRWIGPVAAALLLVAGCGSGERSGDDVDVAALLASASDAMAGVEAARFEIARDGAEVTVQGMTFDGARGEYAAPSSARAVLRVRAGDLAVELGTISIGEQTWLTNPLTGAWEELEPGTGFNPAVIFDPETGWKPLLTTDISDVEYLGASGGSHRVRGVVTGERIAVLTAGIADAQPVELDMRIDTGTDRLLRLDFATTGPEGESDWVIELSDYDRAVTIDPPAGG
jgi:hypothetical protein